MGNSNNEKQLQREQQQRLDARKRLDSEHLRAREKKYATSSPYLRVRAYEFVEEYALQIQKEVKRRLEKKEGTGHFEALKAVVDRFSELEPISDETVPKPTLGFLLMARTIWARVVDVVFYTGSDESKTRDATRSMLAAKIGEDLERTLKLRYYLTVAQRSSPLIDPEDREVMQHLLRSEISYIQDGHGSLEQRRSRAKDFLAEWDTGEVVIRKGRNAGKRLAIPEPFSWESAERSNPWGDELRKMAASELLDMLVCPLDGALDPDDARPFYYYEAHIKSKTPHVIRVRPQFVNELHQVRDQLTQYVVDWLPLITPPLDWQHEGIPGTRNNTGGYHSTQLRLLAPMVRFGQGVNKSTPSAMATELLNTLQSTEWRVNDAQLELVRRIAMEWPKDFDGIVRPMPWTTEELENGTGAAALLPEVQYREDHKHENPSSRTKAEAEAWGRNNQKLSERYREVAISVQRIAATTTMLARLQKIQGGSLWFGWSYDSRFRAYPICGLGSPQGRSCERYSLEFANGQRLNQRGVEWALRAIGAAANDTKGSVQSRIDWARQNLDLIRMVAEGTDQALEAAQGFEEPLNLVSLCRAWVQHEAGGLWHAPVYVDATNSGWQFVAALQGSRSGMAATNLLPATYDDVPADAYKLAMRRVIHWINNREDEYLSWTETEEETAAQRQAREAEKRRPKKSKGVPPDEVLALWLEMLNHRNGSTGRALVKAVARTAIYGSASRTWSDDIEDVLQEENSKLPEEDRGKFSRNRINAKVRNGLADVIGRALSFELGSILEFTKGIREMAKQRLLQGCSDQLRGAANVFGTLTDAEKVSVGAALLKESTHGISWLTPDGSRIHVCEYVQTTQRFSTLHHGKPSFSVTHTESMDFLASLKAVAPGVIHGLDSTLLRCALAHLRDVPFTTVHDAVGALPNDMDMITEKLRDGFLMATPEGYLQSIADEWEVPLQVPVVADSEWRKGIHQAVNMFN